MDFDWSVIVVGTEHEAGRCKAQEGGTEPFSMKCGDCLWRNGCPQIFFKERNGIHFQKD